MQNNEDHYQRENNNNKDERKERTGKSSMTGNDDDDFKAKVKRMKEIIHDFKGNNGNRQSPTYDTINTQSS